MFFPRRQWGCSVDVSLPSIDGLISAFVTLIVIIEPIALVPIFLGLTRGLDGPARSEVAARATVIAFLVLAGCALFGDWLLRMLGISLPAFRIAGGLLLFWISFEMLFGGRSQRKQSAASTMMDDDRLANIAAFPLAIPLLAGPGAITAVLLLAGQSAGRPLHLAALIAVIALVIALSYLCLRAADRVDRLLGTLGNAVISRLLGIILAALAVQFVIDGVRAAFPRM
jgi:multiple antibiotic resistance protein